MGASISRLQRFGGDINAARASLDADYAAGKFSPAQRAMYENPATRDAFYAKYIGQTTKGKYSGVLGTIANAVTKIAPIAAPFIPGVGPLAAGAISAGAGFARGKNVGSALLQGTATGLGSAALRGVGPLRGAPNSAGIPTVNDATHGSGGIGGILGKVGGGLIDFIKADPERAIRLGLGGVGAIQASHAAGQASDLQHRALAPLFDNSPNPFDTLGADIGNPYAQPATRRNGRAALRAELLR